MKVLVVDDETDIRDLYLQKFRKEIRNNELQFVFAHSGEEALNVLVMSQNHLVLTDINMPGMSGIDLLKTIKSTYADAIKVIMVTAYGDEENYNNAINIGAEELIPKPVNFDLLKEKIKIFLS